jgi:hypothetical protein
MSAAKHTPRPWTARGENVHGIQIGADKPNHPAGYVGITSVNTFRNRDEGEANARLIAAAPELLAALKFLVDRGLTYFEGRTSPGFTREQIEKAREAIAKAEGRTE